MVFVCVNDVSHNNRSHNYNTQEVLPGLTVWDLVCGRDWQGRDVNQIGRQPPLSSNKARSHFPFLKKATGIRYDRMVRVFAWYIVYVCLYVQQPVHTVTHKQLSPAILPLLHTTQSSFLTTATGVTTAAWYKRDAANPTLTEDQPRFALHMVSPKPSGSRVWQPMPSKHKSCNNHTANNRAFIAMSTTLVRLVVENK
jgi:hypothetical protein